MWHRDRDDEIWMSGWLAHHHEKDGGIVGRQGRQADKNG